MKMNELTEASASCLLARHHASGKAASKPLKVFTARRPFFFSSVATYHICYPLTEFSIHEIRMGLKGVHLLVLVAVTVQLHSEC